MPTGAALTGCSVCAWPACWQGAFVSDDDGEVMLTARGRTIARVFRRLRALYRVGAGGG